MVATTETFRAHTPLTTFSEKEDYNPRFAWTIALSLLALQFLPYLLLWDEAYIRIHDTLEGIDYQNLFAAGKTFDYSPGAKIEQLMNGLPRAAVKTGWSFVALWHWLFGLYGGYIFNYMMVHLTAFFGMYLLLRDQIFTPKIKVWLALGVALCYAWLPVFTMLGMSVAGLPLMTWAMFRLTEKQAGLAPWLVLLLFPFCSDIVWAGIPVLGFGGSVWLYFFWKTGDWNGWLFTAVACMAVLYIATNWQLFHLSFWPSDFQTHRLEYDYFYNKNLSLSASLSQTAQMFFLCYHHVGTFVSVPVVLAALVVRRWSDWEKSASKIFATILVVSAFYGFYNFIVWAGGDYFGLLKSFKFERLILVLPMLWLLLFTLILSKLEKGSNKLAAWFLATQLAICMLSNDEFAQNLRQLAGQPRKPNFKAFFDEKLFSEIDRYIGQPKASYRVVSLGMHPSVVHYNGFYTLDLHASLYDLRYKHQFRKIMADELAKSSIVKKEFDLFGNRCYLYSAELGKEDDAFLCGKNSHRSICQLSLNAKELSGMGGKYLFSAVKIENAEAIGLRLRQVFEGKFWQVHLYEVIRKNLTQ